MSDTKSPGMTVTLTFVRDANGDTHVHRTVDITSASLQAVHDAMDDTDHAAIFALLRNYTEPFVGLFSLLHDLRTIREAQGRPLS